MTDLRSTQEVLASCPCMPTVRSARLVLASACLWWWWWQVVEGRGVGVVVRVGDHTMIGRIAHLASGVDSSSGKRWVGP